MQRIIPGIFVWCVLVLFVWGLRFEPTPHELPDARWDEPVNKDITISHNLKGDLWLMWRTVQHGKIRVSPASAVNAANRVFATLELKGKTTNEVFATIGHNLSSNDSFYKKPFGPASDNALVYIFDCWNFGWQFNLSVDENGRVKDVERRWIH